jgi:hypothetical protein
LPASVVEVPANCTRAKAKITDKIVPICYSQVSTRIAV